MIEVKAIVDNSKDGCNVDISMEGNSKDLLNETLAIIKSLMGSLKEEDAILHLLALKAMADNKKILCGEESEDDKAKMFERFVATASIKKGVN